MTRTERFECEVHARVTLSRYASSLKQQSGMDLAKLLRSGVLLHADRYSVRRLVVSALRAELLSAKEQLPPRGLIEDTIDEWLEAQR